MKRPIIAAVLASASLLVSSHALDASLAAVLNTTMVGDCVDCHEDCPLGQHVAAEDWEFSLIAEWHRNGGVHLQGQCVSGSCEEKHGPRGCDGFAQVDAESIRLALAQRDVPGFVRVAGSYPDRVIVNYSRNAVQIASCDGAIVAHLPVDSKLVSAIARAMAD